MQYIVTRWSTSPSTATQQATITIPANHLEALNLSGLKEPGALISLNRPGELNIRYQVNSTGEVIEFVQYGSKGE